ncbi:MAG: hypothetical protein QM760_21470 [Nibricoccus sp.]
MKTEYRSSAGLRCLVLSGALSLLAGCTSIDSTTTQFPGVPHPAPTNPASVEIIRTEPTKPHDKLGEISVDVSTETSPTDREGGR